MSSGNTARWGKCIRREILFRFSKLQDWEKGSDEGRRRIVRYCPLYNAGSAFDKKQLTGIDLLGYNQKRLSYR